MARMKKIIYSVGFLFVVLVAVSCMRDSAKAVPELQEIVFLVEDATPVPGADGGLSVETKAMPEPRREPLVLRLQEDSAGRNAPDTSKMVMKDSTGLLEASAPMSSVVPPKKNPRRFHMEAKASLSTETARMDFPDLHDGTKADVTSLSTFNLVCMTGSAGNESQVWALSGTTGSTGKYWPDSNPSYRFAASNASITFNAAGCTVAATNATDVVVSYLASPAYKTTNTLQFKHVFGQIADVTVSPSSGFTASDITGVSISIVPKTGGTYNIRTDAWSDVTTGTATSIANSTPGTKSNALMLVPGKYAVSVAWNAKGSAKTDELEVTVSAGEKLNLEIALGGSSDFVEVSEVWVEDTRANCHNRELTSKSNVYYYSLPGVSSVSVPLEYGLEVRCVQSEKGPRFTLGFNDPNSFGTIKDNYSWSANNVIQFNKHAYTASYVDIGFGNGYFVSNYTADEYNWYSKRISVSGSVVHSLILNIGASSVSISGTLGAISSFTLSSSSSFSYSTFINKLSIGRRPTVAFYSFLDDKWTQSPEYLYSMRVRHAYMKNSSGTYYFNFIPVKRNSDNKYGLYDSVSKTFITEVTSTDNTGSLVFLGQ